MAQDPSTLPQPCLPAVCFTGAAPPEPEQHHEFWSRRVSVIDHFLAKALALESVLYGIAHDLRKVDNRSGYLIRKILLEVQTLLIKGVPKPEQYDEAVIDNWSILRSKPDSSHESDLVLFPDYTDIEAPTPFLSVWGLAHIYESIEAIFENEPATIGNTIAAITEIRDIARRLQVYRKWEIDEGVALTYGFSVVRQRPLSMTGQKPISKDTLKIIRSFLTTERIPTPPEICAISFSNYQIHYSHVFDIEECIRKTVAPEDLYDFFESVREDVSYPDPKYWKDPTDYVPYRNERLPADVLANLDQTKDWIYFSHTYGRDEAEDWLENPHYNDDANYIDRVLYDHGSGYSSDDETPVKEVIQSSLVFLQTLYYHATYNHRRSMLLPMSPIHQAQATWKQLMNELFERRNNPPVPNTGQTQRLADEIEIFNDAILTAEEDILLGHLEQPAFVAEYVQLTPFWPVSWNALGVNE
jgi:hypothetical protein